MKNFDFLVCYDISNHKRLAKVARSLEKVSMRIQKSIFFYPNASKQCIEQLVNNLTEIINSDEDDVRIYKIDVIKSISLQSAIDLRNSNIVI